MLSFRNYIEAAKRRQLEGKGEEGFSLIELIIVVVIIAILAAIAVPIFLGIQQNAKNSAVKGIAGNAAAAVAADLAQTAPVSKDQTAVDPTIFTVPANSGVTVTVYQASTGGSTLGLDNFCVIAAPDTTAGATGDLIGADPASAGPGAADDGKTCK